jgi:hypothetical protein
MPIPNIMDAEVDSQQPAGMFFFVYFFFFLKKPVSG